jgi:flagellar motility protein MotE (MotC chaperone)
MDDESLKFEDFSGRKNGFYKNISTIDLNFSQYELLHKNRSSIKINYNPSSIKQESRDSVSNINIFNDETINTDSRNSPDCIFDFFKEIRDLKQSFLKLQKKVLKKEKESEKKSEKIKILEKVSERNSKKIEKIENLLENHQEKIMRFEGIFREIEYKKLSDIKEQEILRPYFTERKLAKRHTYKDYKNSSGIPSPKIKNREGMGKLKSLIFKK